MNATVVITRGFYVTLSVSFLPICSSVPRWAPSPTAPPLQRLALSCSPRGKRLAGPPVAPASIRALIWSLVKRSSQNFYRILERAINRSDYAHHGPRGECILKRQRREGEWNHKSTMRSPKPLAVAAYELARWPICLPQLFF